MVNSDNKTGRVQRIFLLTCFACCSVCSFGQLHGGWYKTFSGTVGNKQVVLHLVSSVDFQGYFWFRQQPFPVAMTGMPMHGDSIELSSTDAMLSLTLAGTLSGNSIVGTATLGGSNETQAKENVSFQLHLDTSFTPFKEIYARTESKLPAKLKNQSIYSYFTGTIWPLSNSIFSKNLQSTITKALSLKSANNIVAQLKSKAITGSEKWYAENSKLSRKQASEMGLSLSEKSQEFICVMYEDRQTIDLAHFVYNYSGGAHGNYGTFLYPISKPSGKKLRLADILTAEGIASLPKLLESVARTQFKAPGGTLKENGFFVDTIPVSKQFYVTSAGIGFLYNPCEIMPYAAGQINLLVPYSALNGYLKESINP